MAKRIALSLILALFLWSFALPAFAEGGQMLLGESLTLKTGETYRGDVLILGGNLTLEKGSTLDGDVAIFGGRADIAGTLDGELAVFGGMVDVAGTLEGDLVVFGGNARVRRTGRIEGDVAVMGGKLEKEEGAVIEGEVTEMKGPELLKPPLLEILRIPRYTAIEDLVAWLVGGIVRFIVTLLALTAASVLIISLWPEQVKVVAGTLLKVPWESGGIGLAAIVLGIPVGLVLIVVACLGLFVWLGLLITGLFGLTALAYIVGGRILETSGARELSSILQVILGVVLVELLGLVPCLGFLLRIVVYSFGIGAVILSRFGTYRGYCEEVGASGASSSSPEPYQEVR